MAISTYKVFLMKKTSSTWGKLICIKDFPDLGGAPNTIETTTLCDGAQTYINGIKEQEVLSFTANYTSADYQALVALENASNEYAVWFGGTEDGGVVTPTGSDGKFSFTGELSVYVNGGGVNEVVEMTISISPSTPITFSAS